MYIPDPRWEEPNLLIPGRKPVRPVVVDENHAMVTCPPFEPLSEPIQRNKYLEAAWLFRNAREGNIVRDGMGSDGFYLRSAGGGTYATAEVDQYGPHVDCTSSGSCVRFDTTYDLVEGSLNQFQFTLSFLLEPATNSKSLCGLIGDNHVHWGTTTDLNVWGVIDTTNNTKTGSVGSGLHRITATIWKNADSTEGGKLYLDGKLLHTQSSNSLPTPDGIIGLGNLNINLNRNRGMKMYDFFFWDGVCLSEEAVREHYLDPYQFLIPA